MKKMKMGFDVVMDSGALPKPVKIKAWTLPSMFEGKELHQPFKYHSDLLMGLSMMNLNPKLNCPVVSSHSEEVIDTHWKKLDPHFEMWNRCQSRVKALAFESKKLDPKKVAAFEKQFSATLQHAMKSDHVDLVELWSLIDSITHFEEKQDAPLIYHFGIQFSAEFTEKLHALYSFLFHLRGVVAIDWNAHTDDPSHEALKVDSVSDYLPKPEYVAHDAVLYWQFKKLAQPWNHGKQSDVRIEKLFVEPLSKAFQHYVHNACYLVDNLPPSFLEGIGREELSDALHLVQMDWLLGSHAGLLFRVREELFGLQNGYEKIFWPENDGRPSVKKFHLSVAFEYQPYSETKKKAA